MLETVSERIEIDASPAEILEVLVDFTAYPRWAAQVDSVRVIRHDDAGRALDVEYVVTPGPLPKARYVLRYRYPADGLSWEYVEGDLKDLYGSYTLVPGEGSTLVVYDLAVDPGRIPAPGFVRARVAQEITKVALDELKRRVETGRTGPDG